ncbi:MAG: cytidine deaminase [Balneola sp.]|nr:MAG: cytidine deaminase [Balneola sp.]
MIWSILKDRSYVPYSGNPKACVVQGDKGGLFTGVRIENVSFPLTITAIQSACCICLSEGETPSILFIPDEAFDQFQFWQNEFGLEVNKTDCPTTLSDLEIEAPFSIPEKDHLMTLLDKAVPKHSNFPVSSLLYTANSLFEGVNIEVSDWAMGLCAERVALSKALAAGKTNFERIAVHTKRGEVSSPCGACRQVLIEHLPMNKFSLYHADGSLSEHLSIDLLPFSFTSQSLKH